MSNKEPKMVIAGDTRTLEVRKFISILDASKYTHADTTSICDVCKGKYTNANGWMFAYLGTVDWDTNPDGFKELAERVREDGQMKKAIYVMPVNALGPAEVRKYNSARDCARALGLTPSGISMVCRGVLKSHKGYVLGYTYNYKSDYDFFEKKVEARGFDDLTGREFENWLVLDFAGHNRWGSRVWKCRCVCGRIRPVVEGSLTSGRSTCCGCRKRRRAC